MRFQYVTLFPEFFQSPLAAGLMGKARAAGIVDFSCIDPRDFARNKHRHVDDRPYGGGPGMVMQADPLARALESIPEPGRILLLTPRGRPLDQALARELAESGGNLTLICGRYEGLDERIMELFPVEPVCLGDFVLTGGEAAALCLTEAVARLLPGFMGKEESGQEESFSAGLLEYPHYTRPEEFRGLAVPEVLLSGDHARIAAWRRERSLDSTLSWRPELLADAALTPQDAAHLRSLPRTRLGRSLFLGLCHHPVQNRSGETVTVSLTNLDVHDMSRVSRSYDLGGAYVLTPLLDQQRLARTLLRHWVEGPGGAANPDRAEALRRVAVLDGVADAVRDIESRTGQKPRVVATSARLERAKSPLAGLTAVRRWLEREPVLLVFGTGSGLAPEVLDTADARLAPIRFLAGYNHLPVRAALGITVDRLLGDFR
jgi:tRNA (guanine37-N1)-methyltransferase